MTDPTFKGLCLAWFLSEMCLTRRSGAGAASKDKGSLRIIWLVDMLSVAFGIMAAYRFRECALPDQQLFYGIGIGVLSAGLALRVYAILYLGRFFTINVAIASDHHLVDTGPYRYIRHPSYTGALLLFLGLGLGIGNWLSALIIFVPIFLVLRWRMEIEEQALLEALGAPYRDYMTRTKRLIPLVY